MTVLMRQGRDVLMYGVEFTEELQTGSMYMTRISSFSVQSFFLASQLMC